MIKAELEKSEPFTPVPGRVYSNRGGGRYKCHRIVGPAEAVFENVMSGWVFRAIGCHIYEDGSVEWQYSMNGHFEKRS